MNDTGQWGRQSFSGSLVFRIIMFAFSTMFGGAGIVAFAGSVLVTILEDDSGAGAMVSGVIVGTVLLAIAVACLQLARERVTVSAEGVAMTSFRGTRHWPWSQISGVEIESVNDPEDGMVYRSRLVLADGEKINLSLKSSGGGLSDAERVGTAIRLGKLEHHRSETS